MTRVPLTRVVGASGDCLVDTDRVVRVFIERTHPTLVRRMHPQVVRVLREIANEIEANAAEQLALSRNELLDGRVQTINCGSEIDHGTRAPECATLHDLKYRGVKVLARISEFLRDLLQMLPAGHRSSPVVNVESTDSSGRAAA